MMKLNLLGKTELLDYNGLPIHLPTKKVFLLLSMLVMNSAVGLSRNQLVEDIWPNSHSDAGRQVCAMRWQRSKEFFHQVAFSLMTIKSLWLMGR